MTHIGTAGWNIPRAMREHFPQGKSILESYSQIFNAVEINSSFYRSHQRITYERWAATTSQDFLFSVKVPREITHHKRIVDIETLLDQFLHEIGGLNTKLGPVLIQLPPSLKFDLKIATNFFRLWRDRFEGAIVLEPRHSSWVSFEAHALLMEYRIVYVRADPIVVSTKLTGQTFQYHRLHGSPEIYASSYDSLFLKGLSTHLAESAWVIFDNTKFGASIENALDLRKLIG